MEPLSLSRVRSQNVHRRQTSGYPYGTEADINITNACISLRRKPAVTLSINKVLYVLHTNNKGGIEWGNMGEGAQAGSLSLIVD